MAAKSRFAEGSRVARDKGKRVRRGQRKARRAGGCGQPLPLAEQAERGRGKGGKVAGADRPVHRHRDRQPAIDAVGEHVENAGVHPRAADRDLVGPHHQHGPAELGGYQRPAAAAVAAQQPQAMPGGVGAADLQRAVSAHASGPPVDLPACGDGRGDLASRASPFPALLAGLDPQPPARGSRDLAAGQRSAVQDKDGLTRLPGRQGPATEASSSARA